MENFLTTKNWEDELLKVARPEKVKILSSFFKTQKGGYGYGDKFIGVVVPDNRAIAKKYFALPLAEIKKLLESEIHEFRLSALLSLCEKFRKGDKMTKKEVIDFYLSHTKYINNWDLVDLSAPKILGEYLLTEEIPLLDEFSKSENMWERRIAIISTFTPIKNKQFDQALRYATAYLTHSEDIIHKATGWMLREIGKRDLDTLIQFLDEHYTQMPRTALRYSIEKLSPEAKSHYMKK